METRISELEIKMTFAEDNLEAINKTLFMQQQVIDALGREIKALRLQLASQPGGERLSPEQEIPPHY